MQVTYVDPPSGWKYGFPKIRPPEAFDDMEKWFIDEGYPEEDIDLAMRYSRYWTEEIPT